MSVYVVTGKLGSGKGIISLSRIADYLWRGRTVATNLDLNLRYLVSRNNRKARVIRVPDHPSLFDLQCLPNPNTSYDESHNGLLCLDECATWLNAHDWKDSKDTSVKRKDILNWLLHSRKMGWDVILQIQDFDSLDAQIRRSIAEHVVFCRRTDRLPIPIIGLLLGSILHLPKFHVGFVRYGDKASAPLVGTWSTRGTHLYPAYDTKQIFNVSYPHGVHSLLPPGYINYGRVRSWTWRRKMRLTRILLRRYDRILTFAAGLAIAASLCLYMVPCKYRDTNSSSVMWASLAKMASLVHEKPKTVYLTEVKYFPSDQLTSSASFSSPAGSDSSSINRSYVQVDDKVYALGSRGVSIASLSDQSP